jgi:hypothetical protein
MNNDTKKATNTSKQSDQIKNDQSASVKKVTGFHNSSGDVQTAKKYSNCIDFFIDLETKEQDGNPPDQELINSILESLPPHLKKNETEINKPIDVKNDILQNKVKNKNDDIEVEIKIDTFIGILSKCFIDDCEYHIIQKKRMIHYKENEAPPEAFIRARDYYRQNSTNSDVMILVFADRLEIVAADGSSKEVK